MSTRGELLIPDAIFNIHAMLITLGNELSHPLYSQFITGLTYFLTLDGVVIAPTSVPEAPLDEIVTAIDFTNMQSVTYEVVVNVTQVFRFRLGFTAVFEHVIKTSDLALIISSLESTWRNILTGQIISPLG